MHPGGRRTTPALSWAAPESREAEPPSKKALFHRNWLL
jgi:hypothetical protein